MTRGHLVLEDENKLPLAAVVRQEMLRSTFGKQLRDQSQSIFTNTTIYDKENYCHWTSASLDAYTTCRRANTLVLCFVQTWKDIKTTPSGPLICSQLAFFLFIYNEKNNTVFVTLFRLVAISPISDAQLLTPGRKGQKIAKKASEPPSQRRFNSFSIFSPPLEQCVLWKGPYATMGGVMIRFTMSVYVCVVCHLCLSWKPFRLLSPHQPTHTCLRPLGLSWG